MTRTGTAGPVIVVASRAFALVATSSAPVVFAVSDESPRAMLSLTVVLR